MTKLLVVMLALAGCKDDRAPDPRWKAYGSPVAPTVGDVLPGCDKLVGRVVVDKYLTGFVLEEHKQPNHATRCNYKSQGSRFHSIVDLSFHCADHLIDGMATAKSMAKSVVKEVEDVPGIGRGAIRVMGVIEFWDDDTNCMVTVAAFGSEAPKDTVALARDVAATLTPASLQ